MCACVFLIDCVLHVLIGGVGASPPSRTTTGYLD